MGIEVPRGFEPRSLDSESRVLTVTPRDQLHMTNSRSRLGPRSRKLATRSRKPEFSRPTLTCPLAGRGSAGQQWSATADHAMLPPKRSVGRLRNTCPHQESTWVVAATTRRPNH